MVQVQGLGLIRFRVSVLVLDLPKKSPEAATAETGGPRNDRIDQHNEMYYYLVRSGGAWGCYIAIVSIVVPFLGLTNPIIRILQGNPKRNYDGDCR